MFERPETQYLRFPIVPAVYPAITFPDVVSVWKAAEFGSPNTIDSLWSSFTMHTWNMYITSVIAYRQSQPLVPIFNSNKSKVFQMSRWIKLKLELWPIMVPPDSFMENCVLFSTPQHWDCLPDCLNSQIQRIRQNLLGINYSCVGTYRKVLCTSKWNI